MDGSNDISVHFWHIFVLLNYLYAHVAMHGHMRPYAGPGKAPASVRPWSGGRMGPHGAVPSTMGVKTTSCIYVANAREPFFRRRVLYFILVWFEGFRVVVSSGVGNFILLLWEVLIVVAVGGSSSWMSD